MPVILLFKLNKNKCKIKIILPLINNDKNKKVANIKWNKNLVSKVDHYDSKLERIKMPNTGTGHEHWSHFISEEEISNFTKENTFDNIVKEKDTQKIKNENLSKHKYIDKNGILLEMPAKLLKHQILEEREKGWYKYNNPIAFLTTQFLKTNEEFREYNKYNTNVIKECIVELDFKIEYLKTNKVVMMCWVTGVPATQNHVPLLIKCRNHMQYYLGNLN